jgi:dTDP-D-glucose 4,6-dehydratase
MILVTGGAGFTGSNLVRHMTKSGEAVVNLDKLTYAGSFAKPPTMESRTRSNSFVRDRPGHDLRYGIDASVPEPPARIIPLRVIPTPTVLG